MRGFSCPSARTPSPRGDLTHYELRELVPQTGHLVAALVGMSGHVRGGCLGNYLPPFSSFHLISSGAGQDPLMNIAGPGLTRILDDS